MIMTQEELQKMLTSFEKEVSHIKEWQIERNIRLQNQSKDAGKLGGLINKKNGNIKKLNNSLTPDKRKKNKKIVISKEKIIELQKVESSPSAIAKKLNIHLVTYRRLCKEYGIYKEYQAPTLLCQYCNKTFDKGNFIKSHGENCKHKKIS